MTTRFKTLFKRKTSKKDNGSSSELPSTSTLMGGSSSVYQMTRQMILGEKGSAPPPNRVQRSARVFFSAPSKGMEKEREELTHKYFPLLKSFCDKNGVLFCPVDLRWGITDKAIEDGQILSICLQEIDRSDIFVGMCGQRYGWHNTETDHLLTSSFTKAQEEYPWVEQYSDRSVTEVEFRHGHLNNPGAIPSFFFFRDKAYDTKQRAELMAAGKRDDSKNFQAESEKADKFLTDLKNSVKESGSCEGFFETYATPEEGARMVYTELKSYFDKIFPKIDAGDTPQPELFDHVRFFKRHALAPEYYIGGEKNFTRLDDYVDSLTEEPPLLVVGDSGTGKTTLVSTWIGSRMIKKPNELIFFHYVGCSPQSYFHKEILYRLVSFLRSDLNPSGPKASSKVVDLMKQLRALIAFASERKQPVTIVINDINLINTTNSLAWLPKTFPPYVRVILTLGNSGMNPGIQSALVNEAKSPAIKMENFSDPAKEQLIKQILKLRGKELSTVQMESILFHKPSANPLFLRVLLNELCVHGDFFTLEKKLNSFLQATSVLELLEKVLERLEGEYNHYVETSKIPNLIESITSSVYVSLNGLSDFEITSLIGIEMTTLSIITCVNAKFLISRFGLFSLSHPSFADAIKRRYLSTDEAVKKARGKLIDFFQSQLKDKVNLFRVAQELPYLLWREERYEDLKTVITHPLLYKHIIEHNQYGLINFWKDSKASDGEIRDRYSKVLQPMVGEDLLNASMLLANFLSMALHYPAAEGILEDARKVQESIDPKTWNMVKICNQIATNCVDNAKYDEAIQLHLKNLSMEKELISATSDEDDKKRLELLQAHTLSNLGVAYFKKREFEDAEKYHQSCLDLYKRLNGPHDISVADTLNNIAVLHFGQKKWKEAETFLIDALKLYDEIFLGEPSPSIGGTLLNLAIVKRNLKEFDDAEPLYFKAIDHREKTVGKLHPEYAQAQNGLAVFLMNSKNKPEKAFPLFLENISIYSKVYGNDHIELALARENAAICILNLLEREDLADIPEATIADCDRHQKDANRIFLQQKSIGQSFLNIYHRISEYYRSQGNFEKAHEWTDLLVTSFRGTDPLENFDIREHKRNKALLFLFQGKPTNAISILKEEKYPPNIYSTFYQSVSSSYKNESELRVGLEALTIGLQDYPNDAVFLYNLGHCCALLKNWTESKQYYEKLLSIEPQDVDAMIGLGEAKLRLGEKDTSDLDKALKKIAHGDPRYDRVVTLKKEK